MKTPGLLNITKQAVFYSLGIYFNWFLNWQALICPLLSTNSTPIPVHYHKTSCILFIQKFIPIDFLTVDHWFVPCPASMHPPFLFDITRKAVTYCIVNHTNWFLNRQAFFIPLLRTNATPNPLQYHKKAVFYCFEMYFCWFIFCQTLICPLLITNATPIPVQPHRKSCIVLLRNLFQLTPFWAPMQSPSLINITKQVIYYCF